MATKQTLEPDLDGDVRYPSVTVRLIGQDGNAFAVLGRVKRALQRAGVSAEERELFMKQATAGDYNHLLVTCMAWVEIE